MSPNDDDDDNDDGDDNYDDDTTNHPHTHLLIDLCNIAARCYCSRCPELEINHGVTLTL